MKKQLLVAAATTALLGFSSQSFAQTDAKKAAKPDPTKNFGQCFGGHECAGKSECKADGHGCHGKNECKGKGWVTMSEAECSKIPETTFKAT